MLLEDHPESALFGFDEGTAARDQRVSQVHRAGGGGEKAGDGPQEGGFPRTRRTHKSDELAVGNLEVDVVEADGAVGIRECDVVEGDG